MPEEQSLWGDEWNQRFNRFLERVLGWTQLGESKTDIYCDRLKKKVGIDSVFAYKRNPHANQQIVVVEAKSAERLSNIDKSKVQKWVDDIIPKLEHVPYAPDFSEKFHPEPTAQFNLGLMALWVRDHTTYSPERLQEWLSQLRVPQRRTPMNICFVSNQTIARHCEIHAEIHRLRNSGGIKTARLYIPDYGGLAVADGNCVPIQSLLSKFIFYRVTRVQPLKGRDQLNEYSADVLFYLGRIDNYPDLRFVGLAVRQFQLGEPTAGQPKEIVIYTVYEPISLRNQIEKFRSEFGTPNNIEFEFRRLDVSYQLPSWMEQDD